MPYYNPALSYTGIEQLLTAEAIRKALGQPGLTEYQLQNYAQGAISAMYSPWIQAQTRERMFGQELAERQREFDIAERTREEEMERQATMQAISGATQLATLGAMGYLGYKALKPAVDVSTRAVAETAASQAIASGAPSVVPSGAGYVPPGAVEAGVSPGAQYVPEGVVEGYVPAVVGSEEAGILSGIGAIPSWGWAGIASGVVTGITTGDWEKAATSAAGSAVGAAIGSAILPGVGTVIGGILGGALGGGGGGTVICTELYHQDLISRDLYDTVHKFTDTLPLTVKIGYYTWANSVVSLMQKSRLFTKLVLFITKPIMRDMASRVSKNYKPSTVGRVLYTIGEKVCNVIGCIKLALILSERSKMRSNRENMQHDLTGI